VIGAETGRLGSSWEIMPVKLPEFRFGILWLPIIHPRWPEL